MYIIQRNDGAFVSKPGSLHSYTKKLQDARTFHTRDEAERDRCPVNERVRQVTELMWLNGRADNVA